MVLFCTVIGSASPALTPTHHTRPWKRSTAFGSGVIKGREGKCGPQGSISGRPIRRDIVAVDLLERHG
jgi:hypothetical protein